MRDLLDRLADAPIVPTVMPISVDILAGYIRVLHEEDYPAVEVLCRPLEGAIELLRQINEMPERKLIAIGAGTITSETAARVAVELKPDFIVSPAFSRKVLAVTVAAGIPYIPAVEGFQDVQDVIDATQEHGLTPKLLKLCPVMNTSREYLRGLCGCFPGIRYCPTGDVRLESMETYLDWKSRPGVAAPMGSKFVPPSLLENKDFDAVRRQLRKIRELAEQARRSSGAVEPV
jgi:2-dehydro-3-deoxyphosphogluconate aldolase / (4S)-4-hydroxy-2-oxoglutarate aldolase